MNPVRILVADDDAVTRNLLRSVLVEWGHDTIVVNDGVEAWNVLQSEESPNLLILDWVMPGMDGLEVCRNVRQEMDSNSKYIMMLSGRNSKSDIVAGFEAGADDFLTKPVYLEVLQARLQLGERLIMQTQLEEQLLQSQKMATLGHLCAGLAHDFNNLLTPINGYAQMGLNELPSDNRAHHYLREICQTAEHGSVLIRRMLDFSRPQGMEPGALDLNDLISDLEGLIKHLIGPDVELVTLPMPNLGLANMAPGQMEQVLINLAVNARDAMPDGGRLIIATSDSVGDDENASLHPELSTGRYVTLGVSDNGIGMTDKVKERIFEPFFTTKESDKGTGLGLWTCRRIVEQSGGNISVHSEFGHGTTFEIHLPADDEAPVSP